MCFALSLIGKFSHGKPTKDAIRKAIQTFGLNGAITINWLDPKHILLRPMLEEDYVRFWLKGQWNILDFSMHVFKWSTEFRASEERSIVPGWITFDNLPVHFFSKNVLYSLAAVVGKPLKLDEATTGFSRSSVAHVCPKLDVTKELHSRIWIGFPEGRFFQQITYDELPPYRHYRRCSGHSQEVCRLIFSKQLIPENTCKYNSTAAAISEQQASKWVRKDKGKQVQITDDQIDQAAGTSVILQVGIIAAIPATPTGNCGEKFEW